MTDQALSAAGPDESAEAMRQWLVATELEYEELEPGIFAFALPGEKKLQTPVRVDCTRHSFAVHAFVCRNPDEQHERTYRWLLERNLKMFGVAFAIDKDGDIYLDAKLPHSVAVNRDELDRLMGAVLTYADESFNVILELGFESSIRKEWEWRISRGESTRNLDAFRSWLEADQPGAADNPENS